MPQDPEVIDLRNASLTDHALTQMAKRQVPAPDVRAVLAAPEAVLPVRPGRVVAQKIVLAAQGRRYLLRVFVDVDRVPPQVVTVYRTSKIDKYRSRA